jgi:DNA-binding transcriptional LysR family regulator
MELRHLRYFVAVAEEMHFGRAAQRLHISQPPLSQQIRALEVETGVDLFSRVGRRVQLTLAGKAFLDYARATLALANQGVRTAQRVQRGELGQLSVGFITSMAYTYLPWVLRAFRNRFPEVELVLTEQETWSQLDALQESRLHVGILRGTVSQAELESTTALIEPFIVALPDDHRLARKKSIRLEWLAQDPFVMFPRALGGHFYQQMLGLCRHAGFTPTVSQEAVQMHVAVGLVSARIGVALVPTSMQALPTSGVVFRPLAGPRGEAQIAVVRRAADDSPVVRAFIDVATATIGRGVAGIRRWRAA